MSRGRAAALVLLLGGLFAGGYGATSALGHGSAPPPLIAVNRSIAGVGIGMSQHRVLDLYGKATKTVAITNAGGGMGMLWDYQLADGELIVEFVRGRVVSVETTSPSHRTRHGAGPGAPIALLHGFRHDFCSGGLWNGHPGLGPRAIVTVFVRDGDTVASVIVGRLVYYDLCDAVPKTQEVPPPPGSAVLSVTISPEGAGWVRSDPYLIDCPTACSRPFPPGSTVKLEAHTSAGYTFRGWAGGCSGTDVCTLKMDGPVQVVAQFDGAPPPPSSTAPTKTTKTSTEPQKTTTEGGGGGEGEAG